MKVFNTLSRQKEEFLPRGDVVKMYVCGITPYDEAHLGHAMSYIIFDVIRRYLQFCGYKVKYVQNITDIDNKIIDRASRLGISTDELTEKFTDSFFADMDALNIGRADIYPRATEEIPKIIEVIQGLIDKGYAYPARGSVYFRVRNVPDYGKLAHRSLESITSGIRIEVGEEKEHPVDFVLWKASKPGEPMWASPWGPGRPGWHIECSAMSLKYLGETLDIHGGGQDLVFPHHENELAQSESLTGFKPFVRHWLHNGMVQLGEEKMSKSLGNLITIKGALERYSADAIRIFVLMSHYRSPLTYSEEALEAAERGAERLRQAVRSGFREKKGTKETNPEPYRQRFIEAMGNDFNTAQALAILFDLTREINKYDSEGIEAGEARDTLTELGRVLGLTFKLTWAQSLDTKLFAQTSTSVYQELNRVGAPDEKQGAEKLIENLIQVRNELRKAKQWQPADMIRTKLGELGIPLEDTPRGTEWKPKGVHFFNVATNLCQRFVIGYEEEHDNFYMKGETLGNRPVISCRIFDRKGKFLYALERNNLTSDTPSKYRFMLTEGGWHKVMDNAGNELLRIESRASENDNIVTYIFGTFFDKNGKLAAKGDETGLLVNCPLKMG